MEGYCGARLLAGGVDLSGNVDPEGTLPAGGARHDGAYKQTNETN